MHARILRHDAVTFAQNKVIAPRRIGVSVTEIEMRAIKDSKYFDNRKSRRNVTCRAGVRHLDYCLTKGGGIESSMGRCRHAYVFKAEVAWAQRRKPSYLSASLMATFSFNLATSISNTAGESRRRACNR